MDPKKALQDETSENTSAVCNTEKETPVAPCQALTMDIHDGSSGFTESSTVNPPSSQKKNTLPAHADLQCARRAAKLQQQGDFRPMVQIPLREWMENRRAIRAFQNTLEYNDLQRSARCGPNCHMQIKGCEAAEPSEENDRISPASNNVAEWTDSEATIARLLRKPYQENYCAIAKSMTGKSCQQVYMFLKAVEGETISSSDSEEIEPMDAEDPSLMDGEPDENVYDHAVDHLTMHLANCMLQPDLHNQLEIKPDTAGESVILNAAKKDQLIVDYLASKTAPENPQPYGTIPNSGDVVGPSRDRAEIRIPFASLPSTSNCVAKLITAEDNSEAKIGILPKNDILPDEKLLDDPEHGTID